MTTPESSTLLASAGASLLRELTRPWAPAPGQRILVAVSGGGDSVALLHLLAALAPGRGWSLTVATLDHGLRDEAGRDDRRFVEELAAEFGLEIHSEARQVVRAPGVSTEEAARNTRRSFLLEAAATCGSSTIALGHTVDDQAETVLYRLGRGTGLAGLGAMARFAEPLWRPLLRVRRERLRQLLQGAGHSWREDETNLSRTPVRNRIRAELMPVLERVLGPGSPEALARAAEFAREDEALLAALAIEGAPVVPLRGDGALLEIERAAILHLPAPLLRRILRIAVERISGGVLRPTSAHLVAMESLVRAESPGSEVHLPGTLIVRRKQGTIRFEMSGEGSPE